MNTSTNASPALRNPCRRSASKALAATKTPAPVARTSDERDALVEELMPFVETIARRVSRDIRGKIEPEELIAWGVTGLLQAIDRYQEGHNASLKTYAYYRIRGAMLDNIGKIAPLTRSGYRCAGKAGDFHAIYRARIQPCQLLDNDSLSPEDRVLRNETYQVLGRAMKCLSEEHRYLVQQHYFSDQTLKDAGQTLGKSKSWACRSHTAALEALRLAMESASSEAA